MFDVGFTELLLIGVVALIVVGPEKLPDVIRTGLKYFHQFKSGVANIRNEVERELSLDEIKNEINTGKNQVNKAIGYDELHESLDELKEEAKSIYHDEPWQDNSEVTDEEIEADLALLEDSVGPVLPDADAESNTGVEVNVTENDVTRDSKPSIERVNR